MNNFRIVILALAMFMWAMTTLHFVEYQEDFYYAFQEEKLDVQVNYAVDAAIDEMVAASIDLGMDYADYEFMKVDPDVALDTYITVLLKNLGMSTSENNIAIARSRYTPVFCVAAYDGYYIAEPTRINSSGAYDLVFSLKQPYLYGDGAGNVYALNLGLDDAKMYSTTGTLSKVDPPIDKASQRAIINQSISDALMTSVYKQQEGAVASTIYLPSDMSNITRTNPVTSTSVLAYVANINVGKGRMLESFGIGGARIDHAKVVYCYEKNGQKLYAYTTYITDEVIARDGITLIETFNTPELAAQHGYSFDLDYFSGD